MSRLIRPEFKLDQRFKKTVAARYERFQFRAGVLDDRPHRRALPKSRGLSNLEGGPIRRMSSTKVSGTVAGVGEAIRKRGDQYLKAPFEKQRSREVKAFLVQFGLLVTGATKSVRFAEAALRKVIREPILRAKYGRNTRVWAKVKGFNRKLFDTGQFFRAIVAKITRRRDV